MKSIIKGVCVLVAGSLLIQSCSKFEEINNDPKSASEEQIEAEYALNGSIIGAQMDPGVAERAFVLHWKNCRPSAPAGWPVQRWMHNDEWSTVYYNQVSEWLNGVNLAIELAEKTDCQRNGQTAYLQPASDRTYSGVPI